VLPARPRHAAPPGHAAPPATRRAWLKQPAGLRFDGTGGSPCRSHGPMTRSAERWPVSGQRCRSRPSRNCAGGDPCRGDGWSRRVGRYGSPSPAGRASARWSGRAELVAGEQVTVELGPFAHVLLAQHACGPVTGFAIVKACVPLGCFLPSRADRQSLARLPLVALSAPATAVESLGGTHLRARRDTQV
jgi:hypothetical protein